MIIGYEMFGLMVLDY